MPAAQVSGAGDACGDLAMAVAWARSGFLLVDKLPSAAVFLMHATACLRFAGVRSPVRVKILLGIADADHGDTCGCHSLLRGVFLGQRRPLPFLCHRKP
jgi:hypothetical protein